MGGQKGFSRSAKALPRGRSRSKSPSKKGGKKKSRSVSPTQKKPVDLMSPAAMTNAYYIAHGPVDFLDVRGFAWPNAPKGKKKKGKGKKKKK